MGAVVFGRDDQSAGVLVEPVDNAGPLYPADTRQAVAAMGKQRVYQCSGLITRRRMHHKTGRLVYHDKILVLIYNIQGHRLRLRRGRLSIGHNNGKCLTLFDPV